MPPRIAYPSYAAVWRAVLGNVDYAGFLYGKTGKGKSEWAALQQQHYGAEMDRLHLPGNFSSTGNNLEALAFLVKDALYVIDDFCPTGSSADGQRYHKEADRIIRAQGNRSGRGRSRSDGTPRPAKPPRGLVLGTGEEVPKGQSLRSRMWTLEILEGNMNWSLLTKCQRDAAAGQYAQAMAAYVHWLAPRYEGIRAGLKEEMQILRTQALQGAHRRTPEIVAHLAVGFRYFLQFALDVGAISQTEKDELWQAAWSALGEAAQAQARFLGESDPTGRFIELLVSAVSSGDAHIAGIDGDTPPHPSTWGWREATVGTGDHERREWRPQGKRIGWVDKDALYLDPDASFATAQALANRQGDALPVSPQTLRARLKEDGHLASWDVKRQRNTVRRVVEGREMAVLHLTAKTFTQTGCHPSPKPSEPSSEEGIFKEEVYPTEKPASINQNRPDQQDNRPNETQGESVVCTTTGRNGRCVSKEEGDSHTIPSRELESREETGRYVQNGDRPVGDGNCPASVVGAYGFNRETRQQEDIDVEISFEEEQ